MKKISTLFAGLILSLGSSLCRATLGEVINSPSTTLSTNNSSQKISTSGKFITHEYEKDGNTIREYASESGVVFAVSWRGISKPDLNTLFGSYFNEYKQALDEVPKQYGVKTISMKTAKMMVRRGGRMRDPRGFAYIPSMVPEGVNIEGLP
ncbi:MAG TPA: DUF2844 domain-containing protein [Pseudobdellovibrionaceae bacterium]|jgi:hypothetical protein